MYCWKIDRNKPLRASSSGEELGEFVEGARLSPKEDKNSPFKKKKKNDGYKVIWDSFALINTKNLERADWP